MNVERTDLSDVLCISPVIRADARGAFHESWHKERYERAGLPGHWVQDNVSVSCHGVLRGLHFQHPHGQAKLVSVLRGEILDVAVDIRRGSPTFGRSASMLLSRENGRQLYLPEGYAHGFLVRSDEATVMYKCSDYYRAEVEHVLRWDDPALALNWEVSAPILSVKDTAGRRLEQFAEHELPTYAPPS